MMDRTKILALLLLLGLVKSEEDKLVSYDITKHQLASHSHMVEQGSNDKTMQINLKFSQSPFLYTTEMSFGSNNQKAVMRLSTDTDWTMVTGAECYRCFTKAYNSSQSSSAVNGTNYKP